MSILELENVTKTFDGVKAVNQVSIGFEKGKISALIGPNGAGKTTVFNLINGFLKPDRGEIKYKNRIITGMPPWEIAKLGIGRLFQDVRLFNLMTVKDNVLAAFQNQKGESALMSIVYRWKILNEERTFMNKTKQLLEFVGLNNEAGNLAENLSYGQQKLLSIARLLAADFDVLLLDEPTAGVNPRMIDNILDLIRKLAKDGRTVVVIEHNMNVILEISDWVYFMDDGQVISFGLPNEVLGDPEVRAAYIGL